MNQPETSPRVTVVTPAYNVEKVIGTTISSVLNQTMGDFEMLVVDDGSTDGTAAVVGDIAKADARVRLVQMPRNFGAPAGPRNAGIGLARAPWIAFLDADDIWHADKLRCQLEALERHGAKFCSTRMTDFEDEAELVFTPAGNYSVTTISFISELLNNKTPTSSVIVDAAVMRQALFNEDMRYKAREDYDAWLRCHEIIGSSIKIEHAMVGYRLWPNQISRRKLVMMKRHHFVMRQYRLRNGRGLGPLAAVFTATHFGIAYANKLLFGRSRL